MPTSMSEQTSDKVIFQSAPATVGTLVSAVLEPAISVTVFLTACLWYSVPVTQAGFVLCLLIVGITFPGPNRLRTAPLKSAIDIGSTWLAVLAMLTLIGYATGSLEAFSKPVLGAWAVTTPVMQWAVTLAGQQWVAKRGSLAQKHRSVVVIGSGPLGAKVANALRSSPNFQSDFLGYFDDRTGERLASGLGTKHLGTLKQVATYIREHGVGEVHITLPLASQPRMTQLLEDLQGTTASVFFVPDLMGVGVIQGRLKDMNGIPVVGLCETPFTGINELVKRVSDIVLACTILVMVSPILLTVAIGVRLSGPGPIIFKQRRNGLDGKEIVVYKFRSMRTLDNGAVVRQATRGDPRLTPFGTFIRRTSLDELPQFFNVLQGRMSVVGPRPHAVAHNEQYRPIIKAYMVRHKVKPGITGWAQVNGHRGETDTIEKMQARIEYDLAYLRNWSLGLDLRIILSTIRLVLFDRHAY